VGRECTRRGGPTDEEQNEAGEANDDDCKADCGEQTTHEDREGRTRAEAAPHSSALGRACASEVPERVDSVS
jgi:hypothetical protein